MTYTSIDLEFLARTIATYGCESNLILQDKIESWMNVLKDIKKKFTDTGEIISDMLADQFGLDRRQCYEKGGPIDLIFNTPLDEMPLYTDSEIEWQVIISLWRIAIEK